MHPPCALPATRATTAGAPPLPASSSAPPCAAAGRTRTPRPPRRPARRGASERAVGQQLSLASWCTRAAPGPGASREGRGLLQALGGARRAPRGAPRTMKMKPSLASLEAICTDISSVMSPMNALPVLPSARREMMISTRCMTCGGGRGRRRAAGRSNARSCRPTHLRRPDHVPPGGGVVHHVGLEPLREGLGQLLEGQGADLEDERGHGRWPLAPGGAVGVLRCAAMAAAAA
jgi:hypothetical protein